MTPAIRLLEQHNVMHQVLAYDPNPNAQSYGLDAAKALNLPTQQVFKTLVVKDSNTQLAVAVVPVSATLNLKAMAIALGAKKTVMAEPKQAETSTGYILGGISPLGQKQQLNTVIDDSAFNFASVFVSAGKRGLDVELSPQDLQQLCSALTAPIAKFKHD